MKMIHEKRERLTKAGLITTQDLRQTLFDLLTRFSFEKISVQKISQEAGYPRSTFYNYYDDKFDLLEDYFISLSDDLNLDEHIELMPIEAIEVLFGRAFDYFTLNKELIDKLRKHNEVNGLFWSKFEVFTKKQMHMMFIDCVNFPKTSLPLEIVSLHYCNTIFLVLEQSLVLENDISKEEAIRYLRTLLASLIG